MRLGEVVETDLCDRLCQCIVERELQLRVHATRREGWKVAKLALFFERHPPLGGEMEETLSRVFGVEQDHALRP